MTLASPPGSTSLADSDTAALRRAGWVLALVAGGSGGTDEIAEALHPALMDRIPAQLLADVLRNLSDGRRPTRVTRTHMREPNDAVLLAEDELGRELLVRCIVETAPPHRITDIDVRPYDSAAGTSWSAWAETAAPARTTSSLPAAEADELDGLVSRAVEQLQLPGVLAAVVVDGDVVWQHAAGVADAATGTAPTASSVLRIGSISKTMTALAVMRLVTDGRVELDTAAASYLPSVQVRSSFTVRQLLTHTSGLRDDPRGVALPLGSDVPPVAERFRDGVSAAEQPGGWAYSNDGFALLGQLIEDVAGVPFGAFARRTVFDPLGMTRTDFEACARVEGPPFTGYDVEFDRVHPSPRYEIGVPAAGAVRSTLTDMVRYAGALTVPDGLEPVLPAGAFAEMLRPHVPVPVVDGMEMGLGFGILSRLGRLVAWHNGGWHGATSQLWTAPAAGRAALAFTNCHAHLPSSGLNALGDALLTAALDLP